MYKAYMYMYKAYVYGVRSCILKCSASYEHSSELNVLSFPSKIAIFERIIFFLAPA